MIKLKRFSTARETINKTKRQPSEWEKVFANEATNKGLLQFNNNTTQEKSGQRYEQMFH